MDIEQDIEKTKQMLNQTREEINLKAHLLKKDAHDEFNKAWTKLDHYNNVYQDFKNATKESKNDVKTALVILGDEIKDSYKRIKNTL